MKKLKNIENKIKEYRRQIFTVCDRIIGSPSPQECVGFAQFDRPQEEGGGIIKTNGSNYFGGDDHKVLDDARIYRKGKGGDSNDLLATFDSLRIGTPCNFSGTGKEDGVWVQGQVQRYERIEQSWLQNPNTFSREYVDRTCAPARFGDLGCADIEGKEVKCAGKDPDNIIGGDWFKCNKKKRWRDNRNSF